MNQARLTGLFSLPAEEYWTALERATACLPMAALVSGSRNVLELEEKKGQPVLTHTMEDSQMITNDDVIN